MAERKLFPWFDSAYQGFASGDPDADAWAVRMFASKVRPARRLTHKHHHRLRSAHTRVGGGSASCGVDGGDAATGITIVVVCVVVVMVQGMGMLVCQSFAKNFGLYCERIGALHVVAGDATSASAVLSMVEVIVRPMYSNPPAHGARVVAHILDHDDLAAVRR